jgi:hypothetical protein
MRFKASDWDFICTKCKKDGMYDMIIYNPYTREYFNERVDKECISGTDSYGNPYSAAEISKGTFDIIARKLFMDGGEAVDKNMDIHKYITELPYLDVDGNER